MRPLKVKFPEQAQQELECCLKKEKSARIFRRAQAVLEVVKGSTIQHASDKFSFSSRALGKWIHRYAAEGLDGFKDRPRSGRPTPITPEIEELAVQLFQEDPLLHGSVHSQWTCSELGRVLGEQTGVFPNRETTRVLLKKKGSPITGPPSNSEPTPKKLLVRKKKLTS